MRKVPWMIIMLCIIFMVSAISASANGQPEDDQHMMDDEGWHMMDFRGGDLFMWLLFIIVLGVAIYLVVTRSSKQQFFSKTEESPLDILKRRYANGEIGKEEYEQMKQDLL